MCVQFNMFIALAMRCYRSMRENAQKNSQLYDSYNMSALAWTLACYIPTIPSSTWCWTDFWYNLNSDTDKELLRQQTTFCSDKSKIIYSSKFQFFKYFTRTFRISHSPAESIWKIQRITWRSRILDIEKKNHEWNRTIR